MNSSSIPERALTTVGGGGLRQQIMLLSSEFCSSLKSLCQGDREVPKTGLLLSLKSIFKGYKPNLSLMPARRNMILPILKPSQQTNTGQSKIDSILNWSHLKQVTLDDYPERNRRGPSPSAVT